MYRGTNKSISDLMSKTMKYKTEQNLLNTLRENYQPRIRYSVKTYFKNEEK